MALKLTSNAVLGANANIRDLRVTIRVQHTATTNIKTRGLEAAGIYADAQTNNRVITHEVLLSESIILEVVVVLADPTVAIDETAVLTSKVLNNAATLLSNTTNTTEKPLIDLIATPDSLNRVVDYGRGFVDSQAMTDAFSRTSTYSREFSDTIAIVDAIYIRFNNYSVLNTNPFNRYLFNQ